MLRADLTLLSCAAAVSLAADVPDAVAHEETFAIMSYNVRGLPAQVIEDRTAQIAAIAPLLEDFHTTGGDHEGIDSIVLLQELFDAGYYATLTDDETVSYPHISTKSTAGTFGLGDGVNELSDFAFSDFTRVPWADCFGTNGNFGSDCDTPKGFFFSRHQVTPDLTVDVYDLHADAGQDEGSRTARRANITQLIASINANSEGNAVIVAGDTNSLYTRSPNDNIETLLSGAGMSDVWVELVNGGDVPGSGSQIESGCDTDPSGADCELIDKIFYRSSPDVLLTPTSYVVLADLFTDGGGDDLSDHFPVTAIFEVAHNGSTTTTLGGGTTTTLGGGTTTTTVGGGTTTTLGGGTTTTLGGGTTTTLGGGTTTTLGGGTTTTTLPGSGGSCADPVALVAHKIGGGGDSTVTASDALFVLRSAVGSATCALCLCDVDGGGSVTASDALFTLKRAVGQSVTLNCPPCDQ